MSKAFDNVRLYHFEASDLFNRDHYGPEDAWFTAEVEHSVLDADGSESVVLQVRSSGLRRRDGGLVTGKLRGSPRHRGGSLATRDGYAVSERLEDGSLRSIGVMGVRPLP